MLRSLGNTESSLAQKQLRHYSPVFIKGLNSATIDQCASVNLDTTEKSLTTYAPELLLGSNTSSDDQSTPDCRSNHPQNPESNPVGYDHGCNINQPTNNQPTITDPNSCKSTFSLDSNPDVHDESTVANKDDQNETTSSGSPDCSKDVNPANNDQCRSDSDSDPRQHDSVSLASVCSGSEHKSCEVLKPIMVDILSDSTLIESHTAASEDLKHSDNDVTLTELIELIVKSLENFGSSPESFQSLDDDNVTATRSSFRHRLGFISPSEGLPICESDEKLKHESMSTSDDYPGQFGFSFSINDDVQTKGMSYSEELKKLRASQYAYIPVTYHFKSPPPPGSIIRATVVYAEPSHATFQLHRCQMHAKADTEVQPGSETHVVHCQHPQAQYIEHPITGQYSVIVPLKADTEVQPGSETHVVHCQHPQAQYIEHPITGQYSVIVPLKEPNLHGATAESSEIDMTASAASTVQATALQVPNYKCPACKLPKLPNPGSTMQETSDTISVTVQVSNLESTKIQTPDPETRTLKATDSASTAVTLQVPDSTTKSFSLSSETTISLQEAAAGPTILTKVPCSGTTAITLQAYDSRIELLTPQALDSLMRYQASNSGAASLTLQTQGSATTILIEAPDSGTASLTAEKDPFDSESMIAHSSGSTRDLEFDSDSGSNASHASESTNIVTGTSEVTVAQASDSKLLVGQAFESRTTACQVLDSEPMVDQVYEPKSAPAQILKAEPMTVHGSGPGSALTQAPDSASMVAGVSESKSTVAQSSDSNINVGEACEYLLALAKTSENGCANTQISKVTETSDYRSKAVEELSFGPLSVQTYEDGSEESGLSSVTYLYQFRCCSSCAGLKGSPIKLVFTLENSNVTLGRHAVDLHIWASSKQNLVSRATQKNQQTGKRMAKTKGSTKEISHRLDVETHETDVKKQDTGRQRSDKDSDNDHDEANEGDHSGDTEDEHSGNDQDNGADRENQASDDSGNHDNEDNSGGDEANGSGEDNGNGKNNGNDKNSSKYADKDSSYTSMQILAALAQLLTSIIDIKRRQKSLRKRQLASRADEVQSFTLILPNESSYVAFLCLWIFLTKLDAEITHNNNKTDDSNRCFTEEQVLKEFDEARRAYKQHEQRDGSNSADHKQYQLPIKGGVNGKIVKLIWKFCQLFIFKTGSNQMPDHESSSQCS